MNIKLDRLNVQLEELNIKDKNFLIEKPINIISGSILTKFQLNYENTYFTDINEHLTNVCLLDLNYDEKIQIYNSEQIYIKKCN